MFNNKRIGELEHQVESLKRSLRWREEDVLRQSNNIFDLGVKYDDLLKFLKIQQKECKPGLEYKND